MSVYLNIGPCSWGKCKFCGYNQMQKFAMPTREDLKDMLDEELVKCKKEGRYFKIFNGGSWFSDDDLTPEIRNFVYDYLSDNGVTALRVENRIDKVDWDEVSRVVELFDLTISWGFEIADDEILSWLGKGIVVAQMEEVLEQSFKKGVNNLVYIMSGLPFTTGNQDFFHTVDWLYERKTYVQEIVALTYVPMRGSQFYEELWKTNKFRVISKDDWRECREYMKEKYKDTGIKLGFETYHWRYLNGKTYNELYKRDKNAV